ncbi:MAG: hypothetical protein V4556_06395 [Bacteroidota bacterium]
MASIKALVTVFFISISINSYSQNIKPFKNILNAKRINKAYKTSSFNDTTWRTYLGILKDNKRKSKYYVIKEFNKIRAGSTWHGHSSIYFFDMKRKLAAFVYVPMPDNLPYKLYKNNFYFKYIERGKVKEFKSQMFTPLPKMFCSRINECDEIILP